MHLAIMLIEMDCIVVVVRRTITRCYDHQDMR